MKRWIVVLALGISVPALAVDRPKGKGPSAEELMTQADQKANAGDLDAAAALLKTAADQDATGEAGLRYGRLLETKYDLDLAVDALSAAAQKLSGPKKGEALGRLSLLQGLRGSPASEASAEAAVAADATSPWSTMAMASARARQGKAEEALSLAKQAQASPGGGPLATAVLGRAQEATGDLAAAESSYRSVLDAPGASLTAHIGLARVLRRSGRASEAEPLVAQVLGLAPGAIEAYKESARIKLALNRPAEAVGDAATAAALAEDDPEAPRLVDEVAVAQASLDVQTGRVDIAIDSLSQLRDKHPDAAMPRVGLAEALLAKRDVDKALLELKKAIELDPNLAEAHYQMGLVNHLYKGNAAGAVPEYQKAVALEPGNVVYRTNLGAALVALKDFDHAVEELSRVTATPNYSKPDAWLYIGQAHLGAKRYKDAIAALEHAASVAPNSDQVNAFMAWSYFGLKDSANFKKYGDKARSLGYKEPTLLGYLTRVEAGEAIK